MLGVLLQQGVVEVVLVERLWTAAVWWCCDLSPVLLVCGRGDGNGDGLHW